MKTASKVATFRERLSELFEESEKTNKDLSKELHVSNQTISAWKTGTRSPKEPTIIAIANHFGVSVKWLMGFDVDRNSSRDAQKTEHPFQYASEEDMARLEALHQDPRLGLLLDRSRRMRHEDVEFMLQLSGKILHEGEPDE